MQKKIMLAIFCLIANTYSYAEPKVLASAFKAATSQPVPTSNQAKQTIIPVNKIIAFVNKSVITEHQVDMLVAQAVQNFKQKGIILPSMSDIRSRVIEQLVMQQIQLDLAAKAGIKTNDLEVAEAINNIARTQHMDVPSFKANLAKQGISFDEFRRQIQNQIILDKVVMLQTIK
ncbi:MAG: SurA N-terminal domain-containing protein [Burkholderiales bacterium]